MKTALALMSATLGLAAAADTIAVKTRERGFVSVAEGQTETFSGLITSEPEGKVYKGGEGTLILPEAAIDATGNVAIDVLAGKMKLSPGGTADDPAASAPQIMYDAAAFWVNPGSAVDDGSGRAKFWNDVRESAYAADETQHDRPYAEPVWGASGANQDYINWYANNHNGANPPHNVNPQIVTDGSGNRTGVNFGGVGSTQAMRWNNQIGGIRRLFVVCTAETGWVNPVQSYYDGQLQGYNHDGRFDQPLHTPQTNEAKTPHEDTVVFVNGTRVDPCGTLISSFGDGGKGTYLLEYAFYGVDGAQLSDFYSDRQVDVGGGYPSRYGGDTIHEMAVFTSILTDEEAASVRRYLKAKYGLAKSERAVGVAEGATLEIEAGSEAADSTSAASRRRVVLSGGGTVVKSGAGKAVVASDPGNPFSGSVHIEGGTLISRSPVAVVLSDGDAVSSVAYDSEHPEIGKFGDEITVTANGASSGKIVKTGDGAVFTRALDASVKAVEVREGTFGLVAPPGETPSLEHAATPSVFVQNHSFETTGNPAYYGGEGRPQPPQELDGWTFYTVGGWCDFCGIFNNRIEFDWLSNNIDAPDGAYAAFVKGRFGVRTKIAVSEPGRYEISFRAKNRHENGGGGNPSGASGLAVSIGPEGGEMTTIGHAFPDVHMYQKYRFLTGTLEAGTYVLQIADSMNLWIDHAQTIDDVRVTRVPERAAPGVWPLPNGDFETVSTDNGQDAAYMVMRNFSENGVKEWVIDNGSATVADNGFAAIQAIQTGAFDNGEPFGEKYHRITGYMDANLGSVALMFEGSLQGYTSKASLTFTPPAGTWKLRCRARRYMGIGGTREEWREGYNDWNHQPGDMKATVVAGDDTIDLGTAEIRAYRFTPTYWPNVLTVDGNTLVTLSLQLYYEHGCAIVDDFELQRAADVELVSNGGFEAGGGFPTGWDTYTDGNIGDTVIGPIRYADDVVRDHFTRDPLEGQRCMRVNQSCGMHQLVVVPETGVYRLSYWAQSRYDNERNGRNPIRARLVDKDTYETVHAFDTQAVESTNFVEHVAFARIEAGTYRLMLQGTWAADGEDRDHATLVDRVSLRGVPEGAYAEAPDIDRALRIQVAEGAKLRLDFDGVVRVGGVKYAGASRGGVISAETCPDFVLGPGKLNVMPVGFTVIIR